jgi:hypothetical protein
VMSDKSGPIFWAAFVTADKSGPLTPLKAEWLLRPNAENAG